MNIETLLKHYHDLPELPKALLRLRALLFFEPSVEGLRRCLHHLTYLFPVSREVLSLDEFNIYIGFLKSEHFLDIKGVLRPALVHPLTFEALTCEYSKAYLSAVQTFSELMGGHLYKSGLRCDIEANALRLASYTNETTETLKK